jgi:hypothetical protein
VPGPKTKPQQKRKKTSIKYNDQIETKSIKQTTTKATYYLTPDEQEIEKQFFRTMRHRPANPFEINLERSGRLKHKLIWTS